MGWYDLFSRFYDRSLEPLYADTRRAAADALALADGSVVLDLPCGTGQSFDVLAPGVGASGHVVGIDRSEGMLARARARVQARGWTNVSMATGDVYEVDRAFVEALADGRRPDRLHVFLGLTALDRYPDAFARLWDVLTPGGRCVVVDVHAERPSFQGRMVNLVARADIRRPVWEPLAQVAEGYERHDLPSLREHGGTLFLATGTKPA